MLEELLWAVFLQAEFQLLYGLEPDMPWVWVRRDPIPFFAEDGNEEYWG